MASFHILMPYNYSPNDEKAIQFVTQAFAGRSDVQLTLFHVYTPPPEFDEQGTSDNYRLKSGMAHLNSELSEKEAALKHVGEDLVAAGFAREAVSCVFKKRVKGVAEEIVDKVAGCNLLVISRGAGRVTHFFTRSIYARVVTALRGITICVAT